MVPHSHTHCMYVCIVCMYVCMYVCMCVCVCVCVYDILWQPWKIRTPLMHGPQGVHIMQVLLYLHLLTVKSVYLTSCMSYIKLPSFLQSLHAPSSFLFGVLALSSCLPLCVSLFKCYLFLLSATERYLLLIST